jgi:hypothetical protein
MMRNGLLSVFFFLVVLTTQAETSAIIESKSTEIVVLQIDKCAIKETTRIKILNERGYTYAVYRDYYNSFRKVKSISYSIFDSSGKRVKKLGLSDAADVMFNSSYEVADTRSLILDPDYRNFPFTVEVVVNIHYDGFIDFPDWMPRKGSKLEVKYASLSFTCPSAYQFINRVFNGVTAHPQLEVDGEKKYLWEVKDLPAIAEIYSYRSFVSDQPVVRLSPVQFSFGKVQGNFSNWAGFGNWYLELNDRPYTFSDKTKKDLATIREMSTDDRDLIKNVYAYMQSKTRYVSIQLGVGGFQALPVEVVDKNGYGDCKSLSSYTKALLEAVNVKSNYVLVNAGSDVADVEADFPSNQFNHIFVAVPLLTDTIWLECTSQIVPASFLGDFTDDRNVLWLSQNQSKIIRSPCYSEKVSTRKTSGVVQLDKNGDARLEVSCVQGGIFFDEMMVYLNANAGQSEKYNQSKFAYPDYSITSFKHEVDRAQNLVHLNYNINIKSFSRKIGDRFVFPSNVLNPIDKELDIDQRNNRCEVRHGFTLVDEMDVIIPEYLYVSELPGEKQLTSKFGEFQISMKTLSANKIRISRKVVIKKGNYRGEAFNSFSDYLRTIKSIEQTQVVARMKT